jgi:hypothetical protein
MFYNCAAFNQNITSGTLPSVTTMERMLSGCSKFNNGSTSNDGGNPLYLGTSSALTNEAYMFYNCAEFNQLLIIDETGVTNDTDMFYGCTIYNGGVV